MAKPTVRGLFFHADAGWESKTMRIFLFKWTAISNGQQFLMQKQKPVPIKMLNPKFEENFVKGRDYDPDRERAEKRKLQKQVKHEAQAQVKINLQMLSQSPSSTRFSFLCSKLNVQPLPLSLRGSIEDISESRTHASSTRESRLLESSNHTKAGSQSQIRAK